MWDDEADGFAKGGRIYISGFIVTGSGSGGGHKLMIKGIKNPPNEN